MRNETMSGRAFITAPAFFHDRSGSFELFGVSVPGSPHVICRDRPLAVFCIFSYFCPLSSVSSFVPPWDRTMKGAVLRRHDLFRFQLQFTTIVLLSIVGVSLNTSRSLLEALLQTEKKPIHTPPGTPPAIGPRITYHLLRNNTFTNRYCPHWKCDPNIHVLHPALEPLLNFTTRIYAAAPYDSNGAPHLRILFLGDSVGMQMSQSFQEAALIEQRTVLRYSWKLKSNGAEYEGLHVGWNHHIVVAGWRLTGLMLPAGRNRPLPNRVGGGWAAKDVEALLSVQTAANTSSQKNTWPPPPQEDMEASAASPHGSALQMFDTAVIRIPYGWMELSSITKESIEQSMQLVQELFHVSNVILLTMPIVPNTKTHADLETLFQKNDMIRSLSQQQVSSSVVVTGGGTTETTTAPLNITVLDFANLAWDLARFNGNLMGLDTSTYNATITSLFDHRIREQHSRFIAHSCRTLVPSGSRECPPNGFARDGMHWCNEAMNGRVNGGIACLLSCLHNEETTMMLGECEASCNRRFMSLRPIDVFDDDDAYGRQEH